MWAECKSCSLPAGTYKNTRYGDKSTRINFQTRMSCIKSVNLQCQIPDMVKLLRRTCSDKIDKTGHDTAFLVGNWHMRCIQNITCHRRKYFAPPLELNLLYAKAALSQIKHHLRLGVERSSLWGRKFINQRKSYLWLLAHCQWGFKPDLQWGKLLILGNHTDIKGTKFGARRPVNGRGDSGQTESVTLLVL